MEVTDILQSLPSVWAYMSWNFTMVNKDRQEEFEELMSFFQKKVIKLALVFPLYKAIEMLYRALTE